MLFATKKHLCVFKRNTQRFYFGELQEDRNQHNASISS